MLESHTTKDFWEMFEQLPIHIQETARLKYEIWKDNSTHPSLHFKKIRNNIYSARITEDYRVLGVLDEQQIIWFFIGSHSKYDQIISKI